MSEQSVILRAMRLKMVRKLDEERKARFLQAALKLFVAYGVQNTSTAQIAKEAGTAAGTLFLYFPKKQDLINALLLNIGKEQSEYIHSLLVPFLSAREAFHIIWKGSVQWFLDHMDAYQYVQQVRDSTLVAESVAIESAKFFDFYYAAIQKGLEERSIKPYPMDMIGGFLYQDIVATMNILRTQPDPDDQEKTIGMGFELFWDGIRMAEPAGGGGSH